MANAFRAIYLPDSVLTNRSLATFRIVSIDLMRACPIPFCTQSCKTQDNGLLAALRRCLATFEATCFGENLLTEMDSWSCKTAQSQVEKAFIGGSIRLQYEQVMTFL